MERTGRFFGSVEEAEAADIAEDLAMSPEQRVAIVFELQARIYPDAAQQGLARIYRFLDPANSGKLRTRGEDAS